MLWFCNVVFLFCNFIYLGISNEDIGECSSSKNNETSCCADYYRDSETKSCLPCVGWFGHNCSTLCLYGYFGHGCRNQCVCNRSQTCDPMIGCIITNGEISNFTNFSHMKKIYNMLTRAHGINICYNSTTENIECCTGFTNRTGVCEKYPENTTGNVECKVSDTLTENICAEKCGYSTISDISGICSESEKSEIFCCADYYRDFLSGSCLPCIGSFGHNCSLTCSDGYFGHGCRSKCECNDSQTCEPHIGCTPRNNHYNGSTLNSNYIYIVVAIACILSMFVIGTALYTRRNILNIFKANSDNESSIENREDRILYDENASSSQMIGNLIYPSRNSLQSQPNSYGNTISDNNWIPQKYQKQKKVLLIPHNTVESGYSEIGGGSDHHSSQDNGRDAVAAPLKSNVFDDDYIQAISDETNSYLKTNQNEGSVDKTSRVYMYMEYSSMEQN